MKLGGPTLEKYNSPEEWLSLLEECGYSTAFCPVDVGADDREVRAYVEAAADAGVTIAEVPAFGNNPISPDEKTRRDSLESCKRRLVLADEVGARCCVNVTGSRGGDWAGPHPDNLTDDTFDLIVDSVREIIDDVDPETSYYTLETMPWSYPDSTESYRRLLDAVDRDRFGVHFDPVNLVCSPQRYFDNATLVRSFVDELGPHIRSCHLKDVALSDGLTVHLDEVRPGIGSLDYRVLLTALDNLAHDVPLMLEHLETKAEYERAADYVRTVAADVGVTIS